LVIALSLHATKSMRNFGDYLSIHAQADFKTNSIIDQSHKDGFCNVEFYEEQSEDEREESESHIDTYPYQYERFHHTSTQKQTTIREYLTSNVSIKNPIPYFILYSSLKVYC
jgi:hypothetical protein